MSHRAHALTLTPSSTCYALVAQVVTVEAGATVVGAPKGGHHYLTPKPNPWDVYQDYGHSHWEDALLFGRALVNVTVRGEGTIDGGGQLAGGNPQIGDGCKMFGIVSCESIAIEGVSLRRGGWFTLLATNVTGLRVEDVNVTAARDGLDVVGCRDVLVNNVRVEGGGDDAMVFKSDYSLGVRVSIVVCANSHACVHYATLSQSHRDQLGIG